MKIHGLCLVKNEVDVIGECLHAAAQWCDRIYVLDNGSDDGTWETVGELASRLQQVVSYGQDLRPFDSGIREEILRHYAADARPEDWWCILDADEFYIEDPRDFLGRVPSRFQVVWKQDISYLFTEEDLAAYRRDPSLYGPAVPVQERLRYYSADWSEIRFFRHSAIASAPRIPWESPRTFSRRIRVKHIQYRSPEQIQNRLETRRAAIESGIFAHENRVNWAPGTDGEGFVPGPAAPDQVPEHWEERVVPTTSLHFDARDGSYAPGKPWSPPRDPGPVTRIRAYLTAAGTWVERKARRLRKRFARMRAGG